jgi:hypothetical protein
MAMVAAGTLPPRAALSVEFDAKSRRLLVVDGNSTLFCFRLAEFRTVLCRQMTSAHFAEKIAI